MKWVYIKNINKNNHICFTFCNRTGKNQLKDKVEWILTNSMNEQVVTPPPRKNFLLNGKGKGNQLMINRIGYSR